MFEIRLLSAVVVSALALMLPGQSSAADGPFVPYASDSCIQGVFGRKTGFFHVEELGGRPTMVDPLGRGYVVLGVDHVGPSGWPCKTLGYSPYGRHVQTAYRNEEEWTKEAIGRLKAWGFNTLGNSGSAVATVGRRGLSHAIWLDMCGRMCHGSPEWRILPDRQGRGSLFPNVFHPDFEKECDSLAKKRCAPCRNDPWLLGYYIDNELSWWGFAPSPNWEDHGSVLFDVVKAEEPTHTARQALEKFLNGREPTPELKIAFTRLVAERYFSVTTAAIRRHDPNHLVLGCRFAGDAAHPVVFEEAGKYCDVVTVNFYPQADLNRNRVMDWSGAGRTATEYLSILYERSKKPLLITEWSFPALDTVCPCHFGAGQRFSTQKERTQASELFAKTLLAHKGCLGYNYFMWVDEPALGVSGPKSEDSNYGLVNEKGVPYAELTGMFTRLHAESSKWRTAPPPPERAYTPPKPVSEWDQFLKATAGDCGQVGFVRTGECWRLTNSVGLALSGRIGSRLMVDEISLGGKAIGNYGAMIKINVSGPDRWLRATNLVDVVFEPRQKGRVGTLRLTADGESEGVRFRLVHRLFVTGGRAPFAAQVVSVANLGRDPIDLRSVFMLPLACEADPEVMDMVQHLWRGPRTCGWRLKDGSTYVIASHDPSVGVCSFSVDAGGTCHGECDFTLQQPRLLRAGDVYRSDIPMSAVLTPARPVKSGRSVSDEGEYGFTFFRDDGESGIYLARSKDGYHWKEQSGGVILKGTVGGGLTRDPSVLRGPDGVYHMVWTTDWSTNGFGLAHSKDLRTWTQQEFVPVMASVADAPNVWAPELFYDAPTAQYVVVWASTVGEAARQGRRDHRQWCATTRDFKTWSKARLMLDPGFNVIDAFPVRHKGRPLLIVKDEREDRKCLFVVRFDGESVLGPCAGISEPFTRTAEAWAEGPTALELPSGVWVIYFDQYVKGNYGAVTTRDFKTFTPCRDFAFPGGIRHGTTFRIR